MTAQRWRVPLAVVLVVGATTPFSAGDIGWLVTSLQVATVSLIALSFGLAYGLGGMLSAAQATFASTGAYVTAIVTTQQQWPIWAGLGLAVTLPGLIGYALARLIGGLSHMTLGLATLIIGDIFVELISRGGTLTGGYIGLAGVPFLPGWAQTPMGAHLLAWLSVLVAVVLYANLASSTQGAALRTIGHDMTLARSLGIPVKRRLGALFALSSAVAGYAGWLYAHTTTFVSPESLPVSLSVTVFLMVIVGGRRSVAGPLVGAVGLTLLSNYLPGTQTQGMLYGSALVVVVLLCPEGLAGVLPALRSLRSRAKASA